MGLGSRHSYLQAFRCTPVFARCCGRLLQKPHRAEAAQSRGCARAGSCCLHHWQSRARRAGRPCA